MRGVFLLFLVGDYGIQTFQLVDVKMFDDEVCFSRKGIGINIQIRNSNEGDRKQVYSKRKFTFIKFRTYLIFIIICHVYLFLAVYRIIRNNFYFCFLRSLENFYNIYSLDKILILIFVLMSYGTHLAVLCT